MGLSPLEGLPMGTRSGSIDPTILSFMANQEGLTFQQIMEVLNKESGVLGVSGVSSDFRDIEEASDAGNERAQLALKIFDYDVIKYIGAYLAVLGGADAIVFTAGLGENGPETRERICAMLEGIGVLIDKEKNKFKGQLRDITAEGSKVRVLVIPTDEELVIARDTKTIVEG
jgi:acetate kinase